MVEAGCPGYYPDNDYFGYENKNSEDQAEKTKNFGFPHSNTASSESTQSSKA